MKLIYDVPNEPPIYLVNDDEAEYNATQLNAALPNAAPGTIITKAGFGTAKQKAEDGSWSPLELGGGGGSATVYLTTSTETNLNGLISGNGSNLAAVSIDASPTESSTNPVQSGGTYTALAGKAPTSHATDATTYGAGTGSNYGHVKLSDATDSSSDTTGGIAATPKAVKAAYDLANGKQDPITVDASPTASSTNPVQSGGVYDALALKAPLASPTLTGTPAAPTAAAGTNTTQIATTAFVQGELAHEILYYSAQTVNTANNAQILRIPSSGTNAAITTDTVVLECTFANPQYIESDVTWTSYDGYIAFTGTCATATTANVVLGRKGNS